MGGRDRDEEYYRMKYENLRANVVDVLFLSAILLPLIIWEWA